MKILVTDLDGTLLHPQTYSFEAAQPALAELKQRGIPLVLSTSKTRAEVEIWRRRLDNSEPFIVENGGAIFIPRGYFPFRIPGARRRAGYDAIELGPPYPELVEALHTAASQSGCEVFGFHDMTVAELSIRTLLPVQHAELAKQREYDEPFEILGEGTYRLLGAIEGLGKRWTRGDRFYHITGNNDKALAARQLILLYRRAFGQVLTLGVGDGHNDARFLSAVDVPIIVQSRFAAGLRKAVPRARLSRWPGPFGWNQAVLEALSSLDEAGAEPQTHAVAG